MELCDICEQVPRQSSLHQKAVDAQGDNADGSSQVSCCSFIAAIASTSLQFPINQAYSALKLFIEHALYVSILYNARQFIECMENRICVHI